MVEARRRAWNETTAVIFLALDAFAVTVGTDRALHDAVHAVRRSADDVSSRLLNGAAEDHVAINSSALNAAPPR